MSLTPHGGKLQELLMHADYIDDLQRNARSQESITLSPRQLCDLELLLNGGFSPLNGFMTEQDYESVIKNLHLHNGVLWPIPINLDVSSQTAKRITLGQTIALQAESQRLLALMEVTDRWKPNKLEEAQAVFGTTQLEHPGVNRLMRQTGDTYLGGRIVGVALPHHTDFIELRYSPRALRQTFEQKNWRTVVAFQTRNPMHRAHIELTLLAAKQAGGHVLIHPVVGMTKPGDINYITRLRCYQRILPYYPKNSVQLSVLPIAMRMAGPREALWHGIIRKNYGCTHFIVGRDHAGPGKDSQGKDFYAPYAAQELFAQYQPELEISMIPFKEMVYVKKTGQYQPRDAVSANEEVMSISGTELRHRLKEGLDIPSWFSYPEVIEELKTAYRQDSATLDLV